MEWTGAADPRWASWQPALAATAVAALAVAVLAVADLRHRRPAERREAMRSLALAGGGAALFAAAWVLATVGPSWDASLALASLRAGVAPGLRPLVWLLAWLGSVPALAGATFTAFALLAARGRWRLALAALSLCAAVGVGVVLHAAFPRAPPVAVLAPATVQALLPTPFAGTAGMPALAAMVAPALVSLVGMARAAPARDGAADASARGGPAGRSRLVRIASSAVAAAAVLGTLLAGHAWPSDILAGSGLAAVLVGLVRLALGLSMGPGSVVARATAWLESAGGRVLVRPMPWLLGAVALGVALRVATLWTNPLGVDAFTYAAMGKSFLDTGTFWMPWGDVHTYDATPVPSHHYPPLYPMLLAGAFAVAGYSFWTVKAVGLATGLAAILVTYVCSRDLYGRTKGLAAAAVVALSPIFIQNTAQAYSENLVLLLFVATMWAILRSLDSPWHIVAAGVLAGLGYLTKSSMGYFFVIAGLGGLAWRLHWKGVRVLREAPYLLAIAAFGTLVAAWAYRNWGLFGSWETSAHLTAAYAGAFRQPLAWGERVLVTLPFYFIAGYLVLMALLPWLTQVARMPKLGSEHDSGLWLAFGLPLLLTAVIDAALWMAEVDFYAANIRYIGFVVVPLAWLVLRNARPDRATRVAVVLTALMLVPACLFFAKPKDAPLGLIAEDLRPLVADGESVGFVDLNIHAVYRFHFALTHDGHREVPIQVACIADPHCPADAPRPAALSADWVLMQGDGDGQLPSPYRLVEGTHAKYDPDQPHYVSLWRRSGGA